MPGGAAFASGVRAEARSRARRSHAVRIRAFPLWEKSDANGRCLLRLLLAF